MVHVTLADRPEFLAGDHTLLRELLHPAKQPLALGYSVAHGTVAPGARSKWHRLTSSEVYYIIAGRGRLTVDDSVIAVETGSVRRYEFAGGEVVARELSCVPPLGVGSVT